MGVDPGRQRRRIADLDRNLPLPLRLERRHVHDDAAAGVRTFAEADHQHVARDTEIFDRVGQHEAVGRNGAGRALAVDKAGRAKRFRIHHVAVDIGKNLERVRNPGVVTIAAEPVRDHSVAALTFDERLDHGVLGRHAADPVVGHHWHLLADGSGDGAASRARDCSLRRRRFSRSAAASRSRRACSAGRWAVGGGGASIAAGWTRRGGASMGGVLCDARADQRDPLCPLRNDAINKFA